MRSPSTRTGTFAPRFEVWDMFNDTPAQHMFSLWGESHPESKIPLDSFRKLVHAGHGFVIAFLHHRPIAYVWFNYLDRPRGRKAIQTIEYFVIPHLRGKDIPKKLIQKIITFARQRKISLVHMVHNNPRMMEHVSTLKSRNDSIRGKNPQLASATSMRLGTKKTGPYRDVFIRVKPKRV